MGKKVKMCVQGGKDSKWGVEIASVISFQNKKGIWLGFKSPSLTESKKTEQKKRPADQ